LAGNFTDFDKIDLIFPYFALGDNGLEQGMLAWNQYNEIG